MFNGGSEVCGNAGALPVDAGNSSVCTYSIDTVFFFFFEMAVDKHSHFELAHVPSWGGGRGGSCCRDVECNFSLP